MIQSYNIPLSENMVYSNLTLQMTGDVDGGALQKQGLWTVWVKSSQTSWIRHLGAMQAQQIFVAVQVWYGMSQTLELGHSFEQLAWQGQLGLGLSGLPVLQVQQVWDAYAMQVGVVQVYC